MSFLSEVLKRGSLDSKPSHLLNVVSDFLCLPGHGECGHLPYIMVYDLPRFTKD